METFIFIHGSAAGQCSLTIDPSSAQLCGEIGKYYFEGRENRQLMDVENASMFVELYRSSKGQTWCLYSYVINACFGPAPDLRAGNYFALTIALNGRYCKDARRVYNLLSNAYKQIISDRIIEDTLTYSGKTYHDVYKVPQLQNIGAAIDKPLGQALEYFGRDCEPYCTPLPSTVRLPLPWNGGVLTVKNGNKVERLPWNGISIHPDECDSTEAISHLLADGRIIVHEKAERYAERLQRLMNERQQLASQVNTLQQQLESYKRQYEQQKTSAAAASKNAAETERLKAENRRLQERLDKYDNIIGQLSKYQRTTQTNITNATRDFQAAATQPPKKTRWLRSIVLMLILLISIACLVLNICFFRSMPSSGETSGRQAIDTNVIKTDSIETAHTSFDTIQIAERQNATSLSMLEIYGSETTPAAKPSTVKPDFGLSIKDEAGNEITTVSPGQRIKATVTNPKAQCRFHFLNCHKEGNDDNPIWIIIDTAKTGSVAIVSYGPDGPAEGRQKNRLRIK